jgi:nucleotide-binding universal stress UspA family protein
MAEAGQEGPAKVILLHVVPIGAGAAARVRAEQVLREVADGMTYTNVEQRIVEGTGVVDVVLSQAEGADLIIVGATEEPLFRNLLVGNIPEQIARKAAVTVVVVKRRSGPLHSFLRQTVLEPTTNGTHPPPDQHT